MLNRMNEELKQIEALEREANERRTALRNDAVKEAQRLIDEFKLVVSDFRFTNEGPIRRFNLNKTRVVPDKYVGPEGQRWSGRGRTPRWVAELEAKGDSRDNYLVR